MTLGCVPRKACIIASLSTTKSRTYVLHAHLYMRTSLISTAEMPAAQVPILQRRIVQACRARGVPVVIATQMLESMVEQPVPR